MNAALNLRVPVNVNMLYNAYQWHTSTQSWKLELKFRSKQEFSVLKIGIDLKLHFIKYILQIVINQINGKPPI